MLVLLNGICPFSQTIQQNVILQYLTHANDNEKVCLIRSHDVIFLPFSSSVVLNLFFAQVVSWP